MSLGFSANHDAVLLNNIANAGSEQGSFFYVDNRQPDPQGLFDTNLADALNVTLEAQGNKILLIDEDGKETKVTMEVVHEFKEDDDEAEEDPDAEPEIISYTL